MLAEVMQSHVEISVTDNGEGISRDFLPHLFERFSQANGSARPKHRGLGLGLSSVKNLLLDSVRSRPGSSNVCRGSTKLLLTFNPDVIVSDIGTPQKDGYEFIRNVRKRGLMTPAVALSAYARAEHRIRSAQTGYQTHLVKPVEPAELLAVIASLAGRYERTAQE